MEFDVLVIGGGHAGVEAANAAAKLKKNTLLITGDLNKVASLPCNPAIGGPAKGIVVKEVDALGGLMGQAADLCQIQIKLLNSSKGPAVRALRAQIEKDKYPKVILSLLRQNPNITLLEAYVENILIKDGYACGVILDNGQEIKAKSVIITTGTYLSSKILIGHDVKDAGPEGQKTSYGLSKQLSDIGFEIIRLKTGTPPRVKKDTIDYTKTTIQPGDTNRLNFSVYHDFFNEVNVPCYLCHTNKKTHDLINHHLGESSMYSGKISGQGPRYCPSIEDKVVRFSDKEKHQIFLEPEGVDSDLIYLQGLSTSMPKYVQEQILKTIPALKDAKIEKYAYAIEYVAINPSSLFLTLETKLVKRLYTAGQINGTSGYEEAAGQGIIAGINAALAIDKKEPFILSRSDAYIGVLIDDLIVKGATEPYRLLTSRAEYRLLLRNDNADLRLSPKAIAIGMLSETEAQIFEKKYQQVEKLLKDCEKKVNPTRQVLDYLASINSAPIYEGVSIAELIKRPEITPNDIKFLTKTNYDSLVYEIVNTQIKYQGYIQKAFKEAQKIKRLEETLIPLDINYYEIANISSEAKEKLSKIKPQSIAQASRILGVNPADISILTIYLGAQNVSK